MRRARSILAWNLLALLAAPMTLAAPQTVNMVNGIGLIDYASRPKMKPGSWVRYHMTGASQMGQKDDYDVTVLIAADERFWGEDCFWVESWTESPGKPPMAVATLISYDVFNDSFPTIRSQYYMRKTIGDLNPDGTPAEQVIRRPGSTLKKRGALAEAPSVRLDTLGTDTLSAAGITFHVLKVKWQEGKSATMDQRDSSITTEVRENRMEYFSKQVPVTGLVREDLERSIKRRTWAIGRSAESTPLNVMDLARGGATLVAFGENEKSRLLPPERLKALEAAAAARRATRAPAARPAVTAKKKS